MGISRWGAAAVLLVLPAQVQAQSSDDVIVMRRTVSAAVVSPYEWRQGDWTFDQGSSSCSSSVPATRTVTCVERASGSPRADALCRGAKPEAVGAVPRRDGCGYEWRAGDWGPWNSTCSTKASRSRTASCVDQFDGSPVDDARCAASAKPGLVENDGYVSTGCAYSWKEGDSRTFGSACVGGRIKVSQPYSCVASDGKSVSASLCAGSSGPGYLSGQVDSSTREFEASCTQSLGALASVNSTNWGGLLGGDGYLGGYVVLPSSASDAEVAAAVAKACAPSLQGIYNTCSYMLQAEQTGVRRQWAWSATGEFFYNFTQQISPEWNADYWGWRNYMNRDFSGNTRYRLKAPLTITVSDPRGKAAGLARCSQTASISDARNPGLYNSATMACS